MAPAASPRYVALAGAVALLTAGFLLLARLLKLGFIADFLSQTVLTGFLTGVGFQVGIAVLGEMLGVPVSARGTIAQFAQVLRRLPQVHPPTVAVSVVVLATMLVLHRFAPKVPGALVTVAGAMTASALWNFSGHGISVIGPIAGGLPEFKLPSVGWSDLPPLLSVGRVVFRDDHHPECGNRPGSMRHAMSSNWTKTPICPVFPQPTQQPDSAGPSS